MISALVFDCFGVLAEDGWSPFKRKYITPRPDVARAVAELGRQVDIGARSYNDMISETARLVGVDEQQVRKAVEHQVPNEELFAYIERDLKPLYKIGMLSNASYNVLEHLFTPGQVALFDATALSFEVGLTKPQLDMYHVIAQRLGVQAEECVFVDDQQRHLEGAERAGMQGVLYTSVTDLKQAIEELAK